LKRYDDAKRELAEYQKYKDMKDKLRKIYQNLRLDQNSLGAGVTDEEKKQPSAP
jgi:cell division protein FtsL